MNSNSFLDRRPIRRYRAGGIHPNTKAHEQSFDPPSSPDWQLKKKPSECFGDCTLQKKVFIIVCWDVELCDYWFSVVKPALLLCHPITSQEEGGVNGLAYTVFTCTGMLWLMTFSSSSNSQTWFLFRGLVKVLFHRQWCRTGCLNWILTSPLRWSIGKRLLWLGLITVRQLWVIYSTATSPKKTTTTNKKTSQ